jgi:hypothetical protein
MLTVKKKEKRSSIINQNSNTIEFKKGYQMKKFIAIALFSALAATACKKTEAPKTDAVQKTISSAVVQKAVSSVKKK